MSRNELLRQIEVIANMDPGALNGPEPLEDLADWDSLAVLSVISLFDKEFGVVVPADRVHECQNVNDIIALAGDKVTA